MKYLTPIADGIDAEFQEIEYDIWQSIQKDSVDPSALAVPRVMGKITAGLAVKSVRFAADMFVIDALRIGDGLEKAQNGDKWGYVEDFGRALVIGGVIVKIAARVAGGIRAVRGLKMGIDKLHGGFCAPVAAVRGANFQGVYITIWDYAEKAGVSLSQLAKGSRIEKIAETLRKLNVTINEITLPVTERIVIATGEVAEVSSIAHLERGLQMGAKGDVCLVNLVRNKFSAAGTIDTSHAVLVRNLGNGIEYIDRTGKRYRSLADFETVGGYAGMSRARPQAQMLHFPDTRVTDAARLGDSVGTLFMMIAVRVLPTIIDNRLSSLAPDTRPIPPQLKNARDAGTWVPGRMCVVPKANSPVNTTIFFRYIVQPGDSLGRLAQRVYGDAGKWPVILDANRDVFPGMIQANDSLDALAIGRKELLLPSGI
ncbi:MAG TPA: hypothetical protein VJR58_28485 [Vineibacter sp.]|nr:hypothetical protein [Vineibacter sp.]